MLPSHGRLRLRDSRRMKLSALTRMRKPLLALAAGGLIVAAALVATAADTRRTSRRSVAVRLAAPHRAQRALRQRAAPGGPGAPVPTPELIQGRQATGRFLSSYLLVLYGRAPASSLRGPAVSMLAELRRDSPRVTPAQRRRHPRVVSVAAVEQAPGQVLATATITDGGAVAYSLSFVLVCRRSGCVVLRGGS